MIKAPPPVISKYRHPSDEILVTHCKTPGRNYASNIISVFVCFLHGDIQCFEFMLCVADIEIHVHSALLNFLEQVLLIMLHKHVTLYVVIL